MMDCRTARNLMLYSRVGASELDVPEQQLLDAHLAGCPECDAALRCERHVDAHLGKVMREVPIPANLRKRLLTQLAQNREEWYRRWLARGMRVAAVAAAFLIGVVAFAHWRMQTLPVVNQEEVVEFADRPNYNPLSREEATQWFDKNGEKVILPDRFNYLYSTDCGFSDFKGRKTPVLYFNGHGTSAHVYIISSEHFNLNAVDEGVKRDDDNYRFKIEIWKENGFLYIVRYTGELDKLMRPPTKN
jgi:hypothetical protein